MRSYVDQLVDLLSRLINLLRSLAIYLSIDYLNQRLLRKGIAMCGCIRPIAMPFVLYDKVCSLLWCSNQSAQSYSYQEAICLESNSRSGLSPKPDAIGLPTPHCR